MQIEIEITQCQGITAKGTQCTFKPRLYGKCIMHGRDELQPI